MTEVTTTPAEWNGASGPSRGCVDSKAVGGTVPTALPYPLRAVFSDSIRRAVGPTGEQNAAGVHLRPHLPFKEGPAVRLRKNSGNFTPRMCDTQPRRAELLNIPVDNWDLAGCLLIRHAVPR